MTLGSLRLSSAIRSISCSRSWLVRAVQVAGRKGHTCIKFLLIVSDLVGGARHTVQALFFATSHIQITITHVLILWASPVQ